MESGSRAPDQRERRRRQPDRFRVDGSGTANAGAGVAIAGGAKGNTVGGTATGAGNVIGANGTDGVAISGAGTTGNIVAGSRVFESPDGVSITGGASQNTVGGSVALARNFFWFNGDGVLISGSATTGNTVQGNFIGVDVDGSSPLGNGNGVELSVGTHGNTVGAGNVISANTSTAAAASSSAASAAASAASRLRLRTEEMSKRLQSRCSLLASTGARSQSFGSPSKTTAVVLK